MILDKALILKGLGGLTAVGGTAAAAYFGISSLGGDSDAKELLEKAGLKCTFNGNECEITSLESGKKINVKHNNTKVEEKTFTISSPSTAKIKVQKNVTEGGYNQNLRLTIEGGDIALTNGTTTGSSTITKLEEFETYEIVSEGDKHYLSRKKKSTEEKKRLLGLPTACDLPESTDSKECSSVSLVDLKKIKFEGKPEDQDISTSGTTTLTITKTTENSKTDFPLGFIFSLKPSQDLTIPQSSGTNAITIKTNIATEFKIKKNSDSNLTLEKAWTVESLAKKIGISSCDTSNKECTFSDNATLNLFISSGDTKENATISGSNKKIKYEEDAAEHNQGFKFYIDESGEEITLSGNDSKKIEKKSSSNTPTYEIKEQTVGSSTKWYLSKKTNSSS